MPAHYPSSMPFSPVQSLKDLPAIGTRGEDLNLDFKSTVKSAKDAELAKDVAAFANASGGTILIGASEDTSTNRLTDWVPHSLGDANAIKARFENAVKGLCSPVPVIDPKAIDRAPGQFVVAVNVWPHPLLPVGVRVKADSLKTGKEWDAWIVFVRVATQTICLSPEQSAMLMIPTIRFITTLLDSIPGEKRSDICVQFMAPQMVNLKDASRTSYLNLVEIRPLENVVVFSGSRVPHQQTNTVPHEKRLHVPLDEIETVWSLANGGWTLKLKGQIQYINGDFIYFHGRF